MKNKLYTFVALLATVFAGILPAMSQISSPVIDTVLMGSTNEVYYSMSAGNKGAVNRKQWDIAFRTSRMSASILTNDAANNNAISLIGVELHTYPKSDTNGWTSVDTAGLFNWKKMVNSTSDWETGAFCENQSVHPDYGWGKYNPASHDVVGDSLYIIRLRDGSYRKLWIMRKYSSENIYQFRFANIDGTGDNTVMVDCNPYTTKNFVGYSITTSQIIDFEPVAAVQWDILFTKYMYTYPSGATQAVTGVLSNYGIKVNKFQHVAPDYRMWNIETMDSTRSPIGFDWKTYDYVNNEYIIEDSLVYFVQDKGGNIHKLVFKEFVGGATVRTVLEKQMISANGVNEIVKSDLNAVVYPNPVNGVMNLLINPGKAEFALVSLLDIAGRTVLIQRYELQSETLSTLQIPVSSIPAGIYVARIQVGVNVISRKVVVNN